MRTLDTTAVPSAGELEPLRRQRRPAGTRRLPRLLLPHPDALCLGPAAGLFPARRADRWAGCGSASSIACRPGTSPPPGGSISSSPTRSFVADRIRRYYGRAAEVLAPPVDDRLLPRHANSAREVRSGGRSAGAIQKSGCRDRGLPASRHRSGRGRRRTGARAAAGGQRLVHPVCRSGRARGATPISTRAPSAISRQGLRISASPRSRHWPAVRRFWRSARAGCSTSSRAGATGSWSPTRASTRSADGIDKILRMQFNPMDLRSRAEEFSAERFATRLKGYLRPFWPESEGELS